MQTEHLKYVDLVDLHHRFLVQISRQNAPGVAWWPISLTNLGSVTGNVFNDTCSLGGAGGSDPNREILPNLRDFFSQFKYSRVQKSWNEVFFKILKKPSIVQKKMIPHIKGLDFSQR